MKSNQEMLQFVQDLVDRYALNQVVQMSLKLLSRGAEEVDTDHLKVTLKTQSLDDLVTIGHMLRNAENGYPMGQPVPVRICSECHECNLPVSKFPLFPEEMRCVHCIQGEESVDQQLRGELGTDPTATLPSHQEILRSITDKMGGEGGLAGLYVGTLRSVLQKDPSSRVALDHMRDMIKITMRADADRVVDIEEMDEAQLREFIARSMLSQEKPRTMIKALLLDSMSASELVEFVEQPKAQAMMEKGLASPQIHRMEVRDGT